MEDVYNEPLVCLWSVETPLQGPSPSDYPGDGQALGGPHEQGLEDVVVELWVVLTGPVAVGTVVHLQEAWLKAWVGVVRGLHPLQHQVSSIDGSGLGE